MTPDPISSDAKSRQRPLFSGSLYVVAVRLIRLLDRAMGWEPPSEDSTGVWA